MILLLGKDAEAFEKYNQRKLTKKEIQSIEEADRFYEQQKTKEADDQ